MLDFVAKRGDHYLPMVKVLTLARYDHLTIGVAASILPFLYYQLTERLRFSATIANRILGGLTREVELLAGDVVAAALSNPIEDLEDAVQYACATAFGAELILTRDRLGFIDLPIPSISPLAFISGKEA